MHCSPVVPQLAPPSSERSLEQPLVVGCLFLFGVLVRLSGFLQNRSPTGDEAMLALNIGSRSFRQLLQPLDYAGVFRGLPGGLRSLSADSAMVPPRMRRRARRLWAALFRAHGASEPVYIFPRTTPAWVFHTTDWSAPDTARLAWVARDAGPEGAGFVNGASRGPRKLGEGASLISWSVGTEELYGTSTGGQGRMGRWLHPSRARSGWAENEAWRIRGAAAPYIWIVISDYEHGPLDEGEILMRAVAAAGGKVVFSRATADAILFRVRFLFQPG